jgi:hypothetical protein
MEYFTKAHCKRAAVTAVTVRCEKVVKPYVLIARGNPNGRDPTRALVDTSEQALTILSGNDGLKSLHTTVAGALMFSSKR